MYLGCFDAGLAGTLGLFLDGVFDDGSIGSADEKVGAATFDAFDRSVGRLVADQLLTLDSRHQIKRLHTHCAVY